jgi:hypothetical protein
MITTPVVNWGTAGTFPTNSVYSPGIYIRDLYNDPYTSSFYSYLDDNTDLLEISIQQDLQKIFFPGIVTGSSAYGFGGKVAITGSADTSRKCSYRFYWISKYNNPQLLQELCQCHSPLTLLIELILDLSLLL